MARHAGIFSRRAGAGPRLAIASGTVEALKWLALLLMTLDHVNKYLCGDRFPLLSTGGRLAMPLFGFVLAYNLARPRALAVRAVRRVMLRMAVAGLAAAPLFWLLCALEHGWWPLNIMFMLLAVTAMLGLLEHGGQRAQLAAAAVFLLAGPLVDFLWCGFVYCLCAWWWCRKPAWPALLAWCAATIGLYAINGNYWAVAALPLLLAAPRLNLTLPRVRWMFYAYYPAHLAALLLLARSGWPALSLA